MKKFIRCSLVVAVALTGTCAAHAGTDTSASFDTAAGSHFTRLFSVIPDLTNELLITVSGSAAQYSEISFRFLGSAPSFVATLNNGNLVAAFNDYLDGSLGLAGGTSYTLQIDGVTRGIVPGTFGRVSINTIDGTVSPVPESESYAMLLAGLGLIGTIVRRRSKTNAV